MGIFLHVSISKSVTRQEWERVYGETLRLARAFPLAERRKVKCRGFDTVCLTRTVERERIYGWNHEKTSTGWAADGDYETLRTAEEYYLPRDLVDDRKVEPDAGDAMLGAFPAYLDYDWKDPRFSHNYNLWGNKTQGEPYHMYLLAIACLIEFRLGRKAFIYGDITRGQCRKAVELANRHLNEPIEIPDRCERERLWKRIAVLPFREEEKLTIFERFYLGTEDAEFGEYMRGLCPGEIWDIYWTKRLEDVRIGTGYFDRAINDYLFWGVDLEKLCRLVNYSDEEGKPQYEKFIVRILDAKLHFRDKNCEDVLEIDQEESRPYSIFTLMAQFAFAGARNKKVGRYIPLNEIRRALKSGLEGKCNVDQIVDEYLARETKVPDIENLTDKEELEAACKQDASEVLRQVMDKKAQVLAEASEQYEIMEYEDLIQYEKGDQIDPRIMKQLEEYFDFYNSILKEEKYLRLMEGPAASRCEWLIEQNRSILIRDKDWEKIFSDIEEHEEGFARYYPMVRVVANSDEVRDVVRALILNDALYDYCKEMAEIDKD